MRCWILALLLLFCQNCAGKPVAPEESFTLSAPMRGFHKLSEAVGPQEASRVFLNLSQLQKLDYIGSDELWLVAGKREKRILPYLLGGEGLGPLVSKEFISELRLVEGTPLKIVNRGAIERHATPEPAKVDDWVGKEKTVPPYFRAATTKTGVRALARLEKPSPLSESKKDAAVGLSAMQMNWIGVEPGDSVWVRVGSNRIAGKTFFAAGIHRARNDDWVYLSESLRAELGVLAAGNLVLEK